MTHDSEPQRTADTDSGFWTPYANAPVHGTATADGTVDADARPSAVHADAAGWRPVVIEGGRGHAEPDAAAVDEDAEARTGTADADGFDAAVEDALAAAAPEIPSPPAPEPVEPEPVQAAPEAPAPAVEAPAAEPASAPQAPVEAAAAPDSTLRTPHPENAPAGAGVAGQVRTEAPETPHSTPQTAARVWSWRRAVSWLNVYEIVDQPLPPVRAVYHAAWDSVAARTGFDRATEIALVCGVGVPLSIAARLLDRTGHTKWRILGTSATAVLWTLAALTGPVDASTLAWWTVGGYWASTVIVIPAVIKATE